MENRFGFRELVISVLLIGMIVSVWLAMVQFDRQGIVLRQMSEQISEQTHDLSRVRQLIEQGGPPVASAPPEAPPAANPAANPPAKSGVAATIPASPGEESLGTWVGRNFQPFERIRAAAKLPGYVIGDDLVSAFGVLPTKLTPLISSDAYSADIQSFVQEGLVDRDPDTLAWRPLLAKAWRISKDGLRIEFELRRGATFSDGEPITVDDVTFTFAFTMDEKIEDPRVKSYFDKIAKVEKTGPDRVAFYFKEPYFQAFELAGTMSIMPRHFYSKLTPETFNHSTGLLLGSGPYRMPDPSGWKPEPGKPLELVRNERYWGPAPPFDRMIFRIIENDAARLTTFRNGDLDSLGPTPEQYKRSMLTDPELLKRTQHFEYEEPGAGYRYIGWNQKRNGKPTIFADKRVRQAMTMLIDRQGIIDQIELGLARIATGPFSPLTKQSDPSIKPWPYDPERAKALLKDAGFTDRDGSGVLSNDKGQFLRFKLAFPSSGETYQRMVLFMKDTCARACVDLQPDATEWTVLVQRLDQRDFEAITLGWTGGIEDDPYQIFDSSQIAGTGDNFISYANPELDKLIETARSTVDEATRMPLWHRVAQILHEDQPYTFLTVHKSVVFLDDRIKNIEIVHTGMNSRLEWFVPRNLWKWNKPR